MNPLATSLVTWGRFEARRRDRRVQLGVAHGHGRYTELVAREGKRGLGGGQLGEVPRFVNERSLDPEGRLVEVDDLLCASMSAEPRRFCRPRHLKPRVGVADIDTMARMRDTARRS